jgi:XTP/dITP diphosphohydrolase
MNNQLLLATTNREKARELLSLLAPQGLNLLTLSDLVDGHLLNEAKEDGCSFRENAIIKAQHYAQLTGLPTIADDSGLCVKALGGAPGVFSARYGGSSLDDAGRNLALLKQMEFHTDRRACFEIVIALEVGKEEPLCWEGRLEGLLTREPKGSLGFGYDSIFVPDGLEQTLAQMTTQQKNQLSHRAKAIANMLGDLEKIKKLLHRA